ncbi:hypothetical protein [Nitratireductor alexandrii]|uniref:hypothetical protein n=1 Tax=Nitratireductor alexandrii TaxID=2448161 RepID=UPI0023AA5353|nr:hypothetical protein [Nitratireductor alexandrii]
MLSHQPGNALIVEKGGGHAIALDQMYRFLPGEGCLEQPRCSDRDVSVIAMIAERDAGADHLDTVGIALHGIDHAPALRTMEPGRAGERKPLDFVTVAKVDRPDHRLGMVGDENPPGFDLFGAGRAAEKGGGACQDHGTVETYGHVD